MRDQPGVLEESPPKREVRLTQLARGARGRVSGADLDGDDAALLRAMGLKPNAEFEVCRLGRTCIIALSSACGGGCRLGLTRELAEAVRVRA